VIVLDTNVVSAIMAPSPPETVLSWLDAQRTERLFLSTITVAEIGYGLRILPAGKRRQALQHRFHEFVARGFGERTLVFDLPAARAYAEVMGRRKEIGRPMSVPDGEIAAIALARGFAVATRNLSDFEACGLELVDPFGYASA
jgi:toxin FitB